MKRMISLFLSLLMLLTCSLAPAEEAQMAPLHTEEVLEFLAESLAEVLCGEQNGLHVTLTNPDGEQFSGGFGMTESGLAVHCAMPEYTLAADQHTVTLTDAAGCISVPLTTLVSTLFEAATGADVFPTLASLDLEAFKALVPIGQELLLGLMSRDGITYSVSGQMVSLHIDLDAFLRHADSLLPEILQRHTATLDTLLGQLAPLIDSEITVEKLLALWKSLKLADITTGLTLDAVMFQTGDVTTMMASCMNWSLKAEMSSAHFAISLTAPDGAVYAFDTMDLLTVADILGTVPDSITEEAFKLEQTTVYGEYPDSVTTTNITVDFALLERDVKAGLTKAITANQLTVDMLCDKYQPLIRLLTGRVRFNSRALLMLIGTADLLPDWLFACTAMMNHSEGVLDVSASLAEDGEVFVLFDLHFDNVSLNASLRDPEGEFNLMLTGVNDRYSTSFTLSCSEDMGGFHSITYAVSSSYSDPYTSITTDTDIFHYLEDRNGFDLKLDEYGLSFSIGRDDNSLRLRWPDGFADCVVSDVGLDITSNYGSLSVRETYDSIMFNGTIMDGYTPTHFSLLVDSENQLLTASIMPYRGSCVYLRYQTGRLSLLTDGSELVIADAHSPVPGQNITTAAFDGEILATLISTVENGDLTMQLYPGAAAEGACWTLTFDFGAPGKPLPADAAPVPPEEFFHRLGALIAPAPEAPVITETPNLEAPTDAATPEEPSASPVTE